MAMNQLSLKNKEDDFDSPIKQRNKRCRSKEGPDELALAKIPSFQPRGRVPKFLQSWASSSWQLGVNPNARAKGDVSEVVVDCRMLLLGATGSGKTSFLNLHCNFNHINASGKADITKFQSYNKLHLENSKNQMESQTSDASVYRTLFADTLVEIVDTPGFGDTRGPKKDAEHQAKIIKTVSKVESLNCIAVVVSGADARMNVHLEHVLLSIAGIMPARCLPQLFVVYTHVDSLLKLTFRHTELEDRLNMRGLNFIVIDNPYSLLQNAKALSGTVPDDVIASELQNSFQKACAQLQKFRSFLTETKPLQTMEFKILYDKKCEIERATLNLVEDLRVCAEEDKMLQRMQEELEKCTSTAKLFQQYETEQMLERWVCVETDEHNTLCSFPECYHNCHLQCNLPFTMEKAVIKSCWCHNHGEENCRVCKHHFTYHYHNRAKWEKRIETTTLVDETMKQKYHAAKGEADQKQLLLSDLQARLTLNEEKVEKLKATLLLCITEFEAMGSARNYKKLLAVQIRYLADYIDAKEGDTGAALMIEAMREAKAGLEHALFTIEEAEKGERGDPAFMKQWACKVMGLGPSPTMRDVQAASMRKVLEYHPDKPGGCKEMFQRLQEARDILMPGEAPLGGSDKARKGKARKVMLG